MLALDHGAVRLARPLIKMSNFSLKVALASTKIESKPANQRGETKMTALEIVAST